MCNFVKLALISLALVPNLVHSSCIDDSLSKTILGDKLTLYWAQEYIGSDLIKEELKLITHKKLIPLSVFDLGFEKKFVKVPKELEVLPQLNGRRTMKSNHGTAVANLINNTGPIGSTNQAKIHSLTRIQSFSFYEYYFRRFELNQSYPKVISNSLGWSNEISQDIRSQVEQNSIFWFLASGNDYPTPVRSHEINSFAMLVGSFAPSGLTSLDTQIHNDLLIHAPANEELISINADGDKFHFGATSGATPLVAATVVNMLSILPSLTKEQLKTLLMNTAFSSAENKLGNENAPKLLNGYRAFKVAQRISSLCNSTNCITDQLKSSNIYQFKNEYLDTCENIVKLNCSDQEQELMKLRKDTLLNPLKNAGKLSCVYRKLGFNKNAEYFTFITESLLDESLITKKIKQSLNLNIFSNSYYRYIKHSTVSNDDVESSNLSEHRKVFLINLPRVVE